MRRALPFVLLTACAEPPEALTFTVGVTCEPSAPVASPVAGATTPTGSRDVAWECREGCDGFDDLRPLVIFQGDSLTFEEVDQGRRIDTFAVWSIDGDPLYPIEVGERDECWYRRGAPGGCASDFFICESAGRWSARVTVRDPVLGVDQRWDMR